MSQQGVLKIASTTNNYVMTLSSEDGPETPPENNNFNFSGSVAGGSAANGAILFKTPGGPGGTENGQMDAVVQTDGTTIDINASNQLHVIGGVFSEKFTVDANTAPGTNPVVPDASGNITVTGAQIASGSTANVIRTDSLAANQYAIQIQRSQAVATSTVADNGVSHFDSSKFSVDANGFVSTSGTGVLNTLTGNTGGAIAPVAGNINTVGTGSLTTAGSGNTLTTQLTGLTNHAVLVGAGTATITKVGPTATAGQVLQSAGAAADPAFSTATYPSTTTANQILYSSAANTVSGLTSNNSSVLTTSTTGVPSLTPLSANGQLLIGSATAAPAAATLTAGTGITITNASNSITVAVNGSTVGETITGDTGGALSPTAGNWNILANATAGSSVKFAGATSTLNLNVTDVQNNTLMGALAGNGTLTAFRCTGFGNGVFNALTSQIDSTAVGYNALNKVTSGAGGNEAFGSSCLPLLTTGTGNSAFGGGSLGQLLTGTQNFAFGVNAGANFTSSESSNIVIGNRGTAGDSNTIRIGTQGSGGGQQTKCFVAGITGVAVTNKNYVTINTSTGQLGSESASTLFSINPRVFTTSGTYTPTAGMTYCTVEIIGGGGAGGGSSATSSTTASVGSGGGSGEHAIGFFSAATIGASQTVTIGAAGTGAAGATGGTGGTTSLGTLITAIGGTGGVVGAPSNNISAKGGAGGTGGTGGSYRSPGWPGGVGYALVSSAFNWTGFGANSQLGSGGNSTPGNASTVAGSAATGFGAGGAGSLNWVSQASAIAGGNGSAGLVVITEYIIN